ncbi:FecCD family ABC transporter permease [Methanocella arvoryzae]|uniref:Cobalamin import system permease protein BtuC n=1 Tax=Methanocella arvoryzae (strain DSM 22066 / NBRC 105507 / MRE50) TaxID=351160 RepID=Q0W1N7_METAR|nr:iron ABC transporter permease [Methanocella arvoryzae]CAJ37706.1 ABC-type transport system, permease component [Methanocella arvoryzae MRE50]
MKGQAQTATGDVDQLYRKSYMRRVSLLIIVFGLLVGASLVAASVGTAKITIPDVFLSIMHAAAEKTAGIPVLGSVFALFGPPENGIAQVIVVNMRLPRILLAMLAGISLAVAGTVMQGTLRNPLVSPFTLGLASAASFGAAITIVTGAGILGLIIPGGSYYDVIVNAFLFGLTSMILIYGIARMRGTSQATLILSGVVIGYIFQAGVLILKYWSNNDRLKDLEIWLMGGMWGANWDAITILLPITAVCVILLCLKAWDLNALSAGDDIAKNLGIRVERLRIYCLLIATVAASSCLAFTGVIGFIGLMAPHICRMLIGNDHRYLIPCSALMGGLILLVSDTFARTILSPIEIPVGIIMYIAGGIFFMYLILRGKDNHIY